MRHIINMQKTKTSPKFRNIASAFAVLILVLGPNFALVGAQSVQQLREEIDEVKEEIDQSQQRINELKSRENTLANRLELLRAEARQVQSEITATEREIARTRAEIAEKEADLQRTKELIQENVKVLYKEGSPSTIEVLFSSDNFTDFINRQEYLDRAKENMNEAAKEASEIKAVLEEKEEDLSAQALKLDAQRETLTVKQEEQQKLIAETQGEERRYQAYVEDLKQKQQETDRKLAEALAAASSGGIVGGGGSGGSGLLVNSGDIVNAGQHIAYVGSTGFSTGPHLDFMVSNASGTVSPNSPAGSFSTNLNHGLVWPVRYTNRVNVPYGSGLSCAQVFYPTCASQTGTYAHFGIDIPAYMGEPVLAAGSGRVIFSGWRNDGGGYTVMIEHSNGYVTRYSHLR